MDRRSAFASLGASGIHRQWHMTAADGVEVVSIWKHAIDGDEAEAHVHARHFDKFVAGQQVRAVIQQGSRDPESMNMRTESSEPDVNKWIVESKTTRQFEGKKTKTLHVLQLRRLGRV